MTANKVRAPAHPAQIEAARALVAEIQRGRDHRATLLRAALGVLLYSDSEFADLCGVRKSTVAGWWAGRRKVPPLAVDAVVAIVDGADTGPPVATDLVAQCSVCWRKHPVSTAGTLMPHNRKVRGADDVCEGGGSLAVLLG